MIYCYVSTKWLLNKQYEREALASALKEKSGNTVQISMKEVLEKCGFNLFAKHLIKEHSVHHLLFVLEVSKLKEQCMFHGFIDEEAVGNVLKVKDILLRFGSDVSSTKSCSRLTCMRGITVC